MGDEATVVLSDITAALNSADEEAKNQPACLVLQGGDVNGKVFDLRPGTLTIGRSADNLIPVDVTGISRKHLQIDVVDKGGSVVVVATDLGSKNGSYINNHKLEGSIQLKKGDTIKLGAISFKYIPKGDPERLAYDKLNQEAITDGLTRCYNKKYFNETCDLLVKRSKATGAPLTLVLLDLDHFKKLNDNFGHDAGDFVLKNLAELIRKQCIRENDIFARYGGEEFCIILPTTNLKQGFQIAERVRQTVADHQFIYNNQRLPVTASLGVADYRQGVNSGVDLFKRVDIALYKSKDGGRNQVNFYRE